MNNKMYDAFRLINFFGNIRKLGIIRFTPPKSYSIKCSNADAYSFQNFSIAYLYFDFMLIKFNSVGLNGIS